MSSELSVNLYVNNDFVGCIKIEPTIKRLVSMLENMWWGSYTYEPSKIYIYRTILRGDYTLISFDNFADLEARLGLDIPLLEYLGMTEEDIINFEFDSSKPVKVIIRRGDFYGINNIDY